jgi:hypothetical protein
VAITARAARAVLDAVATVHPLGDRDSPRLETCLGYLTRLEAVSHRLSPPSP